MIVTLQQVIMINDHDYQYRIVTNRCTYADAGRRSSVSYC